MDQAQNQFLQAVKDGQLSKASALLANEKIDINQPDQVPQSIKFQCYTVAIRIVFNYRLVICTVLLMLLYTQPKVALTGGCG